MKDGKLRLKACITIEFQTTSFVEAGDHQSKLMHLLEEVRRYYPDCTMDLREMRQRATQGNSIKRQAPVTRTGRMQPYADVA